MNFIQDNESLRCKNVLRGLHIQKYPQGKLVRVVQGTIFDVDLRKESLTYGSWYGIEFSAKNNRQFYVPEGFAHGFFCKK